MHSTCSYLRVSFVLWNLRTETEAGSERGRRREVGGEKEVKRKPCALSHTGVEAEPLARILLLVSSHLECRVTSSVCDCAGTGLSEASAPPLHHHLLQPLWHPEWALEATPVRTQGYWQQRQDLRSWPHLSRRAPRGIWGPETTAAISWTWQRVFLFPYKATELGNHLNEPGWSCTPVWLISIWCVSASAVCGCAGPRARFDLFYLILFSLLACRVSVSVCLQLCSRRRRCHRSGGLIHTFRTSLRRPSTYFLIRPSHCWDYDLWLLEQHAHLGAATCGRNLKTRAPSAEGGLERCLSGTQRTISRAALSSLSTTGCVTQERAAETEGWLLLCDVDHGKVHSASLITFGSCYGCFVNPSGLFSSTGPRSALTAMATAAWYHRDISRVQAEELLARAGKDGSYLVRDSESVPGAYALCLLWVYEDLKQHRPTEIHICGTKTWYKWQFMCICTWFVTLFLKTDLNKSLVSHQWKWGYEIKVTVVVGLDWFQFVCLHEASNVQREEAGIWLYVK